MMWMPIKLTFMRQNTKKLCAPNVKGEEADQSKNVYKNRRAPPPPPINFGPN